MARRAAVRLAAAALAVALGSGGCIYISSAGPRAKGDVRAKLNVGMALGLMTHGGEDLASSSSALGAQVGLNLQENLSVNVIWAKGYFEDTSTTSPGELQVTPISVSGLVSLPPAGNPKSPFRWLLGFGAGFMALNHDAATVDGGAPFVCGHGGFELLLADVARLFVIADIDSVDFITVADTERPLQYVFTTRAGMEIRF